MDFAVTNRRDSNCGHKKSVEPGGLHTAPNQPKAKGANDHRQHDNGEWQIQTLTQGKQVANQNISLCYFIRLQRL